jgi:hypothetical protein
LILSIAYFITLALSRTSTHFVDTQIRQIVVFACGSQQIP